MRRLVKKSDRLELQKGQIQSRIEKGFTLEQYKGLSILTKDAGTDRFELTVFKDSAAHPIANYYYRKLESRVKAIEEAKKNYDYREQRKKEEKENPTKSTSANAALAIRNELKEAFPGVKFSVTSSTYAGGNSVRVSWHDGPTMDQVQEHTGKYQYGHFNGMEDIYEYSNKRDDIPQAKYVMEERSMSDETRAIIEASAEELYQTENIDYSHTGCHGSGNFAYRVFQKCAIPSGAKVIGIVHNDKTCGVAVPEEFYTILLDLPDNGKADGKKQVQTNFESVEVKAGQVQIIDYSERAIAVVGDTKPIKDKLKQLGGKFNARLSCGAGWIFPKTKLEIVTNGLRAKDGLQEEIEKTVHFFEDYDLKTNGVVSDSTREIAQVQNVKLLTA